MRSLLLILIGVVILGLIVAAVLSSVSDAPDPGAPDGPGAGRDPAVGTAAVDPGTVPEVGDPAPADDPEAAGGVAGMVVDEEGQPLGGADVVLVAEPAPDRAQPTMEPGRGNRSPFADLSQLGRLAWRAAAKTGEDGAFRLQPQGDGPYLLTVTLAGFASTTLSGVEPAAKGLIIVMMPGARVSGTVVGAEGSALIGATVTGAGSTTAVLENGTYLLADLPSGEVELTASAPAFAPATKTVKLTPGGTVSAANFVLEPGAGIVGRVLDAMGEPLPQATVRLTRGFETSGIANSNAAGEFAFVDQASGSYVITARHQAYGVARLAGVAFESGERLTGIEIRMSEPGSISGTVLSADGGPVTGALVKATSEDASLGFNVFSRTMTTGANGAFAIEALSPGLYEVTVTASGHAPVRRTGLEVVAGQTTPLELSLEVGLAISGRVVNRAGEPIPNALVSLAPEGFMQAQAGPTAGAGVDGSFTLGGLTAGRVNLRVVMQGYASADVKDVEAGTTDLEIVLGSLGSISGLVRLAEGQAPIPVFEAEAIPATSQFPGVPGFQAAGTVSLLGEGRFRITDLEPGSYTVAIYATDLAPARYGSIEVAEGEETSGLVFDVAAGLILEGVVVADASGAPVEGAEVGVEISGNQMLAMMGMGRKRRATTDGQGHFVVKGLPEGASSVRVTHPDYSDRILQSVRLPAAEDLMIRLLAGGSVIVKVLSEGGTPVAETMVMLQRQFPFAQMMGTTDAEGTVRFDHISPGMYMAIKMNPADLARGGMAGADLEIKTVTVADGESVDVEIRAKAGSSIRGRVTRGGTAVVGTMVYLMGVGETADALSGMKFGMTEEGGAFEIKNVAPGKYTLMVQKQGAMAPGFTQPVEVAAGRETRVDVDLPLGSVAGFVVDEEGAPVPGAQVMVVPEGLADFRGGEVSEAMRAMAAMTTTDEKGRFVAEGMAEGRFVARAWRDGYSATYSDPFETPAVGDGPQDIRIKLGRGSEVSVTVIDPTGKPVSDAWVYVTDPEGRLVPTSMAQAVQTDTSGIAVVRLEPGPYRVEVQAQEYPAAYAEINVTSGLQSGVPVRLERGGVLSVFVTAGGVPVPQARVEVLDATGRPVARRATADFLSDRGDPTRTDENGHILFPLLGAGSYRVMVTEGARSAEGQARIAGGSTAEIRVELK